MTKFTYQADQCRSVHDKYTFQAGQCRSLHASAGQRRSVQNSAGQATDLNFIFNSSGPFSRIPSDPIIISYLLTESKMIMIKTMYEIYSCHVFFKKRS